MRGRSGPAWRTRFGFWVHITADFGGRLGRQLELWGGEAARPARRGLRGRVSGETAERVSPGRPLRCVSPSHPLRVHSGHEHVHALRKTLTGTELDPGLSPGGTTLKEVLVLVLLCSLPLSLPLI